MDMSAFEVGGTDPTNQYLCRPDELLVHVDDRAAAAGTLDGRYVAGSRRAGAYVVFERREGAPSAATVLDELGRGAGRVLRVSPQYVLGTCGPRVPMAADRPQSTSMQFPPLAGSSGSITVGVIDTGVVLHDDEHDSAPHPWLASRLVGAIDEDTLTKDDGLLAAAAGHGTFVAGVVLGEAPNASIRAVATMVDGYARDELVAEAITALADEKVHLLNLSFCGDTATDSTAPPIIEDAIAALPDDVVVVAAAGNFGDTRPVWPAAFERVIAVGAVDDLCGADGSPERPARAPFSGYGAWVDAYAGGVSVLGPFCWHRESGASTLGRLPQHFRGWARWSGTSAATAVVTGRIARVATDEGIEPVDAARRVLRDAPRITVGGKRGSFTRPYVATAARTWNPSG